MKLAILALAIVACQRQPAIAPGKHVVVSADPRCVEMHPAVEVELPRVLNDYCRAGHPCARLRWGKRGKDSTVHVQCIDGIKGGASAMAYYSAPSRHITIWTRTESLRFGTEQTVHLVASDSAHCYADTPTDNWTRAWRLLAHELGHAHGWDHACTNDEADAGQCSAAAKRSIMYPYSGCETKELELRP